MLFKRNKHVEIPSLRQVEKEKVRYLFRKKREQTVVSTARVMVVVAAMAVLAATLWMPVLRIYGNSMTPTLCEGQIVVCIKGNNIGVGDVVGVYYGRKLLAKRCIATERQWINIDSEGNVYVNNELLDEPYLTEKAFGECNIDLPYQVPDNCYFVMGDHRQTSIDSRNTSVGSIDKDNVVGKIVLRVWPLRDFGLVNASGD